MTKSQAIKHIGSLTVLAKLIGRQKSTVSGYSEKLPRGVQYEIQVKTQGQLRVDSDFQ